MKILAVESSCDETAVAVVEDGRTVLTDCIASQVALHRLYGGVVPELASRKHIEAIYALADGALSRASMTRQEIDAIAVTYAPGLIGALLVGVSFAKGLAMATGKPLVPVHHISGHIAANYIAHPSLEPPYLCLVASGGHSHIIEVRSHTEFRVIGRTRDDAAGECFDKCARVLGFPYPGGVHIDRAAREGNPEGYALPRPTVAGSAYDMSFSGLKTAVINLAHNARQKGESLRSADLAASVQHRIAGMLTEKTMAAARDLGYRAIAAAGGVCANTGVRQALTEACDKAGYTLYMPPLSLCGDNGAMIACQGYFNYLAGMRGGPELNAIATLSIEDIGESLK